MQEKRKKFWIIFSVTILTLLSFVFLFGVITNLKTVNIDFKQRIAVGSRLEDNILDKIKNDGQFEYGKGLLFVDVEKSVELIEKKNPFVKVHQVMTKFPNVLNVYIIEREPCFYSLTEGNYLIFDNEFKVLDKFEANQEGEEFLQTEYLKFVAEIDYDFSNSNLEEGDFVEDNGNMNIYQQIYTGIYGSLKSISSVKSIKVENSKILITMKKDVVDFDDGVVIELEGFDDIKIKTWVAVEAYKIIDRNKQIDVIRLEKDENNPNGYYAIPISSGE